MKIHGYTEEKELFLADFSYDEIVDSGLDPWRLDLFDPHPIAKEYNGVKLWFRKLEGFSFAYRLRRDYVVVGLHDGERTVCLVGKQVGQARIMDTGVTIEDYVVSDRPFREHLREYLEILSDRPCPTTRGAVAMQRADEETDFLHVAFRPRPPKGVNMVGGTIVFGGSELYRIAPEFHATKFVGKMHEVVPVPGAVTEEIAWVFQHLSDFEPIVFGSAIRRAVMGEAITHVDVLIADGEFAHVREALKPGFIWVGEDVLPDQFGCMFRVKRQNCTYHIYSRRKLAMQVPPFDRCASIRSADGLFCSDGATFSGSRIACYDVGSGMTRKLYPHKPEIGRLRKQAEEAMEQALDLQLMLDGFILDAYPHIDDFWADWR